MSRPSSRSPPPRSPWRRLASARRVLFLTAVALLGMAVLPPIGATADQVIGRPVLELSSPDDQFSPGESSTLEVRISNEGSLRLAGPSEYVDRVTTARATTIEVSSGDTPIEVETGRYPVGSVPVGTTDPIPIQITVPADTPVGTYELPVRVRYAYTRIVDYGGDDPEFSDSTYNQVQSITVRVTESPRFEVVERDTDVLVGDEGTLSLTLRNVGSEAASDARVAVRSQSEEVRFGTESARAEAFVGSWAPDETREVNYTVRLSDDASIRNYPLNVSVAYEDSDGISGRSKELRTSLRPAGEQRFQLAEYESAVRVGADGTLSGTVVNDGPARAHSPVVVVSTENQHIDVPESEYALADLDPGERATFDFEVEVSESAAPGSRQFSLTVEYRNAAGDLRSSDELVARVPVESERDQFRIEPVATSVTAGGSETVRMRVTNAGDQRVTDVSAKLFASSPLSTDDDEAFVSALDPGESAEVTFELAAGGSALEKDYPVSLDFQYDTAEGDTELSRTYRVPVTVTAPPEGGPPAVPIVVGLVVVAGGAAYLVRRRGRS